MPLLLALIKELATYERLADEVIASPEVLRESLFGPRRSAEAALGYYGGVPVGYAVYFHNFSTFVGRHGLYLEDIYVRPEHRGKGVGRALLSFVAALAVERNCGGLEWLVLDWNDPAIRFYRNLGAVAMDGWTVYRMAGDALHRLAAIR